jgi:hypothetical protein
VRQVDDKMTDKMQKNQSEIKQIRHLTK